MESDYLNYFYSEIKEEEKFLKKKKLLDQKLQAQIQDLGENLKKIYAISRKLQKNIEKLEGINFDFSLNKELWDGVNKVDIKIDGFKTIPLMVLLRKIFDILVSKHTTIPLSQEQIVIDLNSGEFNLLLGIFSVNTIELFNQRIRQHEVSGIKLDFELKKDDENNTLQLLLDNNFFSRQFSYISQGIESDEKDLFIITKDDLQEFINKITNEIEEIQGQIKNIFQEIEGEYEELEESIILKRRKIKNILKNIENEFDEYQKLVEYYLNSKNEILFYQKNIENSPETKFIFKFINKLTSIEKKYDITHLSKKLNVNIPTIKENLARLGFNIYTDEDLGKDFIEISDKNLRWYISHFPEQSEKLVHTLSLRTYKDYIKFLGTKRLAQLIKNGYFYFDQLEEEENKTIYQNTGIPLGWIKKIKKYLPSARNKIKKNKS